VVTSTGEKKTQSEKTFYFLNTPILSFSKLGCSAATFVALLTLSLRYGVAQKTKNAAHLQQLQQSCNRALLRRARYSEN